MFKLNFNLNNPAIFKKCTNIIKIYITHKLIFMKYNVGGVKSSR